MTITHRQLSPADAGAMASLRREMLEDSPHAFLGELDDDPGLDAATCAERLNSPDQASFGAWDPAGRLLSVATVVRSKGSKLQHRAQIVGVYCSPAARGQGLGASAVRACLQWARERPGLQRIGLSVSAEAPAARGLYEHLGFRVWGTEPDAMSIDGRLIDEIYLDLVL